jgi:NADH-quinone oxidoreductase subunit G
MKITIDGREIEVNEGEWLIKAAQDHGTYIPRFCWHERMKPVGMCRMCLVEIEGTRGFPPACTTPVAEGMVVHTQTEGVKKVQDGVLEFLLINHPLDCPVCDRGGECPLQDQTLAFGPGESRFVEEKRHWEKPIPVSDLVLLDRERCIQCARCYRFADEIAGDPLIQFGERAGQTEIVAFPDDPFASYFSGNTVQICPVGALTAKPYRFKARPWDLSGIETSCTTCAVHCRGALEATSNHLVRLLGVDSEPVNQGWLCDKGRFGYELVHAESRIRSPMIRKATDGPNGPSSELVECSWPEALDAAADGLRRALELNGPQSVAVLGGARCTNEDAYVWARFAKSVLRTDNTDAQLGDGLPAEVALGLPHATISDLDSAAAIVLACGDLKEELPVLYLRVKRAAVELGVPLIELAPLATGLTPYTDASLRHAPGEQAELARKLANALGGTRTGDQDVDRAAALLDGRDGHIVMVLGRGDLAEVADHTVAAASALAAVDRARFLVALRRGNVRGALDLGLAPGFLPGRVTLEQGREWFEQIWDGVPEAEGLDALGILGAAEQGRMHALVLLGADPVHDFPDQTLARNGIDSAGFVIAVDAFLNESTRRADVFLPVAMWGERPGSVTNLEGRIQRVGQKISPDGTVMPDWRVASELAYRLGADFDLESAEEVQDEIAIVAPSHLGIDSMLLRRARDGVVVPKAEHEDEIVLGRLSMRLTDASWEPITPQPEELEPEELAAIEESVAAGDEAESSGDTSETPGVAAGEGAHQRPSLHVWTKDASTGAAPARDAYALRLVTGRTLYDLGTTVACSPSLAPLAPEPVLRLHPKDRDRIGTADGATVRATSARGSIMLKVLGDDRVLAGTAALIFNLSGLGAGDLIDAGESVTDIRVESVR